MQQPVTKAVWVCRDHITLRHVKGLMMALERVGALDYTDIHVLPVREDAGVLLPEGNWLQADGKRVSGGALLTLDNLPPQGILLTPTE